GVADADAALRPLAESALRAVIGRRTLESLLTKARHEAERAAAALLQERVDACGLGLVVSGVEFQDVHPPVAGLDGYGDVSRAESDRQRRSNEGATYRAQALASARGQAAATMNGAEAEAQVRVNTASGRADAFRYVSAARASHPALSDHRLYWDVISET